MGAFIVVVEVLIFYPDFGIVLSVFLFTDEVVLLVCLNLYQACLVGEVICTF